MLVLLAFPYDGVSTTVTGVYLNYTTGKLAGMCNFVCSAGALYAILQPRDNGNC